MDSISGKLERQRPGRFHGKRRRRFPHLAALDEFLNHRVVAAQTTAALNAALRQKSNIKRCLVTLADEEIEPVALAVLQELTIAA
jgi:hypothetical protein